MFVILSNATCPPVLMAGESLPSRSLPSNAPVGGKRGVGGELLSDCSTLSAEILCWPAHICKLDSSACAVGSFDPTEWKNDTPLEFFTYLCITFSVS